MHGANPRYPLMHEIRQMYLNVYYARTQPFDGGWKQWIYRM